MDQYTFYLSLKFVYPAACDNGAENPSWYADSRSAYQEVPTFGGISTAITLAQDRDGWRAIVGTVRNFRVP